MNTDSPESDVFYHSNIVSGSPSSCLSSVMLRTILMSVIWRLSHKNRPSGKTSTTAFPEGLKSFYGTEQAFPEDLSWRLPGRQNSELIFMEQAFNLRREGSNFELRSSRHYLSQKSELKPSGKAAVEVFPEGRFLWESLQESKAMAWCDQRPISVFPSFEILFRSESGNYTSSH